MTRFRFLAMAAFTLAGVNLWAQGAAQAARTPRAMAPTDITGYWVSIITEDWRFRMVTPPKGDYASIPLNTEGRKTADQWDFAKDVAAGEQCRVFGAASIMRMPVRLHITWQDDTTLKIDVDNGNQVRLFHFGKAPAPGAPSLQGSSVAEWENVAQGEAMAPATPGGRGGAAANPGAGLSGSLKVVTTNMKPGYLRRNGVPYSGNALMTEFFDRTAGPHGDSWLVLTSVLDDPQYLTVPYMLSTHYKMEPDGSKFNPRPCEMTPPVQGAGH